MAIKKFPLNNICLKGSTELSGDKSISIRAVLLSAWAHGISNLENLGTGEDVKTALNAIKKLKIITKSNEESVTIFGGGFGYDKLKSISLNMGNSGTCTRLITGQLASSPILSKLYGDNSLTRRPLRIKNVLENFNCNLQARKDNFLPLIIKGNSETVQSTIKINKPSAQIISSAIFCAINSHGVSEITAPNNSRDHTEKLLQFLKYPIKIKYQKEFKKISIVGKKKINPISNYRIPSDPSSAAFLIVLAILTEQSNITIRNILCNKHRIKYINILKKMGAKIKIFNTKKYYGEIVSDINVKSSKLRSIKIRPNDIPAIIDELPILFIAAAFAKGKTFFPNLSELKIKESNRLQVMYENLKKCGINCILNTNALSINGKNKDFYSVDIPEIDSKKDHRIALSFLVLAAATRKKILINDFNFINISFPEIEKIIKKLTVKPNKVIVAIDGKVSSGKTSICKSLQKKYKGKAFFFDSGTLYRRLSLLHLRKNFKKINVDFLVKQSKKIKIKDLSNKNLHSNEVSKLVPKIAKIKEVRSALLDLQRKIIFESKSNIVLVAGRDIGSKILPNNFSDLKLFIDAPIKIRALRRFKELKCKFPNKKILFKNILEDIKARDKVDSKRKISPLVKVKSAHLISNHTKYISTPVMKIIKLIKKVS